MAISLITTDVWNVASGVGDDTHVFSAAPEENDIVYLQLGCDNNIAVNGGIASGEGYTDQWRPGTALPGLQLAWKRMGATPDTSVDITKEANRNTAIIARVFRGVTTGHPIDNGWSQAGFASTTAVNPPTRTSVTDNAWNFVFGWVDDDNTSSSAPTGYTNYAEVTAGGSANQSCTIFSATRVQATAGAHDPAAFGTHSSDAGRALHFALRPAEAGLTTKAKRMCMLSFASPIAWQHHFEVDGSVDADDRAHLLHLYCGNPLGAPVPIDSTKAMRFNMLSYCSPLAWQLHPDPDGAFGASDRAHLLHLYGQNAFDAPPAVTFVSGIQQMRRRRRVSIHRRPPVRVRTQRNRRK